MKGAEGKGATMPKIDFRIPLFSSVAFVLLATAPAKAADEVQPVQFVASTTEAVIADAPMNAPAPLPFADTKDKDSDTQADMMELSEKLADPRMQDGVANMVGKMTQTMMDLPIGNFVTAIEKAMPGEKVRVKGKRVRAGDTIADLAGRDADRLPGQIDKGVHQAMGMMSGFAAAFASMIPEFEKMGDALEQSFEDIEDASRSRNRK
jgi:hypothetical protein